jgi:UDP-N-acetylmuramyl pentapeptide phosphotransferase/UDP-N-acetylglucosamine-1-phosphate transferase
MPGNPPLLVFIAFGFLALASYGGVAWVRGWLLRRQILDIPNQRSSHTSPKPRGGGLAIVVLVLIVALIGGCFYHQLARALVYAAAGGIVAWLGWRDDLRSLSTRVRFLVQGGAALLTILGLGYFQSISIPALGELRMAWVGVPVTLLWIVGLTNAFNFMDGIDGISGGVAFMGGLGWVILAALRGESVNLVFWIALAVAATNLGFLGHNWAPAKVFIGDVASTFLGFTFAVLPLLWGLSDSRSTGLLPSVPGGDALLLGTAIMWAYILDSGITFLRRLIKGEAVFAAHRTHVYQRLVISGYRVPAISLLYILLTLAGVLLAIGWQMRLPAATYFLLPGMPLAWAGLYWYADRRVRVRKV